MVVPENFDLDAYFDRIGYGGTASPDEETLRDIYRLHVRTFPFENLNPLLRRPIPLDLASLQRKMVQDGRGGYCYEQNLLLSGALRAIGLQVTGLAARVLSEPFAERLPPRTHMLIRIDIGSTTYVGDAGFGGMTLSEPIRLEPGLPQPTSHEPRRILPVEGDFVMQASVREKWRTLYRFNLEPQALSDYEMANFYVSTRPGSHFLERLSVARPTDDGRYTLRNNELAEHDLDGNTNRRALTSADELRRALQDLFLLRLPDDDEVDALLEKLARGEDLRC